jgi:hypothetical protein
MQAHFCLKSAIQVEMDIDSTARSLCTMVHVKPRATFCSNVHLNSENVRTSKVYSNKFTLVRINKLLIAYHLNIPMYQLIVSLCPATFP